MRASVLTVLLALVPSVATAETVAGTARIIDGDTLVVDGRTVRLFGIDAPERGQSCHRNGAAWPCGDAAAGQLASLIDPAAVTCTGDEDDQYGRLVAVCTSNGFELNRTMVQYGWATAFRRYSDAYVAQELRARAERRGIWAGSFELPENHRAAQAPIQEAAPVRAGSCVIKGNRNRRGQWIYHLPGMPYYNATRAEEMFCSEEQARAAGYRRAIVR